VPVLRQPLHGVRTMSESSRHHTRLIENVVLSPWVYQGLLAACADGTDLETCGVFTGRLLADGSLIVLFASGAGIGAERQVAYCSFLSPSIQGWLDAQTSLYRGTDLCGLWHIHPGGSTQFSGTDARTFREWVTDPDFNLPAAVFPVIGRGPTGEAESIEIYYADERDPHPRPIGWTVLDWADPRLEQVVEQAARGAAQDGAEAAQWGAPMSTGTESGGAPSVTSLRLATHSRNAAEDAQAQVRWQLAKRGLDAVFSRAEEALWRIDVLAQGEAALVCMHNADTGECLFFRGEPGPSRALTLEAECGDLGCCLAAAATSRGRRFTATWRRRLKGIRPTRLVPHSPFLSPRGGRAGLSTFEAGHELGGAACTTGRGRVAVWPSQVGESSAS